MPYTWTWNDTIDEDTEWAEIDFASQFVNAVSERLQACGLRVGQLELPAAPAALANRWVAAFTNEGNVANPADTGIEPDATWDTAGDFWNLVTPTRKVCNWRYIQRAVEAMVPYFVNCGTGALDPASYFYDAPGVGATYQLPMWDIATWRAAAGIPAAGFSRLVGEVGAEVEGTPGFVESRDIVRPLFFQELMNGLNLLLWTRRLYAQTAWDAAALGDSADYKRYAYSYPTYTGDDDHEAYWVAENIWLTDPADDSIARPHAFAYHRHASGGATCELWRAKYNLNLGVLPVAESPASYGWGADVPRSDYYFAKAHESDPYPGPPGPEWTDGEYNANFDANGDNVVRDKWRCWSWARAQDDTNAITGVTCSIVPLGKIKDGTGNAIPPNEFSPYVPHDPPSADDFSTNGWDCVDQCVIIDWLFAQRPAAAAAAATFNSTTFDTGAFV